MATDFKQLMSDISKQVGTLHKDIPDTMGGFSSMSSGADKPGALDSKTKEFVALGIAIGQRCEPCIAFHTRSLIKLGCTKEEFEECLGTAIYMGGGPSLMYAAKAMDCWEQLSD
ncbi:alkylhydroperoxidase AhpD family core domain-containing protein [Cohaesibacter sp. ES.047]|uniref:carboxymuconolactone decarboxylase family protein n=1 Tax=Cohaesibacter sp. ES.047 TaxID=1798205 RepID=UPI000BB93528|nr:carboxymuconolactone decarboxylase family protein [Cohaesibacter sp. ES.047]SNY93472.1 alkylhydroperoxidase AhpD family core domain-containing protein [Cohaesibacter sp. ES.047]